jgi:predicted exporter
VLLAETRAEAVDIAAQEQAISAIQQAFAKIPGANSLELEMTGVGAFGVEMQKVIQAEAKKRTLLASSVLLLVLLIVYRKPRFLILAALPVGMGFLVGLAVVTLVFEKVHGITLAFGFTLLGVAVDYPLHLFSHSRKVPADVAIQQIWPTLRLGALSTAIAYAAIALSGSSGLAQLGVFTACGVIISLLVTRTWLPLLVGCQNTSETVSVSEPQLPSLIFLPAILILGFAVLSTGFLLEDHLWDDGLSSLSPVPERQLARDTLLRSAATTPDMRYQLVLHGPTLESLLQTSEAVDPLLQHAVDDGLLVSWQSISQILPSQARQKIRRDAIPESKTLHANLIGALAETPFSLEAFEPFEANARATKNQALLTPGHFKDTSLASWLDSHLIKLGDHWVSLISLSKPKPAELAARIQAWNAEIELVNLQQSSLDLVRDYRLSAIKTIFLAVFVIIALLLFQDRNPRKVAWIVLTVTSALAVTILVVTLFHAGLTIIHLVALLLVIGLGMDYALFFSRAEPDAERRATRHAVLACAATTSLTFGILAGSSLPVLNFMGLTVATGSAASFILAFVGSKQFRYKVGQENPASAQPQLTKTSGFKL